MPRLATALGNTSSPPSEIEQIQDFSAVGADLRSLLDAAEAEDFQSGLDWFRLLAETTCAAEDRVALMVLRRDGQATAALPMLERPRGRGSEVTALANYYSSRFIAPVQVGTSVEELSRLVAAVRQLRPRPVSLTLAPMDRDDPRFAMLRGALSRAGLVAFDYFCFGNWYLPTEEFRGAAEDYLATRPGEVRSTLRRMTRRFDAAHGRIEILSSAAEAERAIAAFTSVYALSWKRPEPHPGFMPGLIRLCAGRGWLRMGVAWLDGQPIAAQLWVVCDGRASIFKLAYDERHARHSPGTLLTAALMRQVLDVDRVQEVDYLTGDDAYKRAWMTHRRERWGLVAYDPRTTAGAWLAVREAGSRLVKAGLRQLRGTRGASSLSTHQTNTSSAATPSNGTLL